ncbi:MAG: hypothetical protein DRQ46_07655 [Gammaproteobacteria bacterium]|nr:MAG: hypothetical protein DRQ46_07655 [Gammaproteobacteria bacterium]
MDNDKPEVLIVGDGTKASADAARAVMGMGLAVAMSGGMDWDYDMDPYHRGVRSGRVPCHKPSVVANPQTESERKEKMDKAEAKRARKRARNLKLAGK